MFKFSAEEARKSTQYSMGNCSDAEICSKIEAAIKKAAENGQYSADYVPSYKDQLLQNRPNSFKDELKKLGYSVQFRRDDNPREGNNEIILVRITWGK
jgi:hypothetical protein